MGRIVIDDHFYSPLDRFERTLRIYLPDTYDTDARKRYPVLYMTDGQNVFEHPRTAIRDSWQVNLTLDRLYAQHQLEREWIVCAIDHAVDRFSEYTPWPYPARSIDDPCGRKFLNNLTECLIPYMHRHYRVLSGAEHTGIAGSSLGGLISLFCGRERPDVFGRIGAVSPSLAWSDYRTFAHWKTRLNTWTKIYMDMGTNECVSINGECHNMAEKLQDFYWHLRHLGYADYEVMINIEQGANHHETDWARRFPTLCRMLLNDMPFSP